MIGIRDKIVHRSIKRCIYIQALLCTTGVHDQKSRRLYSGVFNDPLDTK